MGFFWKKSPKLLNKANPEKRQLFLKELKDVLTSTLQELVLLVYVDEAHLCLDCVSIPTKVMAGQLKENVFGSLLPRTD